VAKEIFEGRVNDHIQSDIEDTLVHPRRDAQG